ncbi:RidA family protein (plasmid) [Natronosalvus halobius]|nr:RidA family protein [Natronosalvus halobius]USZ73726.1 RidA family protein [Natronosalvus halobius]
MERREVSTGTDWEAEFGYSRAVRVGDVIRVSGTAAVEDGEVVGVGDAYAQTAHILETIEASLAELDVGREAVVSTTIYVTDFDDWQEIGDAYKAFFDGVRPATTLLEVSNLPNSDLKLEIEATAAAVD